ncbi:hypothetical protein C8Q74DRAFT_723238 [Fomes fomentarius]|nr:hypothetical protein C8Q74DRAFT_723238 [Fomes fomentarius]
MMSLSTYFQSHDARLSVAILTPLSQHTRSTTALRLGTDRRGSTQKSSPTRAARPHSSNDICSSSSTTRSRRGFLSCVRLGACRSPTGPTNQALTPLSYSAVGCGNLNTTAGSRSDSSARAEGREHSGRGMMMVITSSKS